MPDIIVTTSRQGNTDLLAAARVWGERLNAPVIERAGRSLERLARDESASGILVITPDRVSYHVPSAGTEYFFHPNMARTRLHNLRDGRGDPMITAMALSAGDSVLDCTLGRAADAIVAAHVVGDAGRIVGLEVVPVVAQLTIAGLAEYEDQSPIVTAAMRRIEAHQASYAEYLPTCPDSAFDIVYFDPIFDQPLLLSEAMAPLRAVADHSPLTPEMLAEAKRVARRRVVIKQRKGSRLWERLGITQWVAGGGSRVEYGVVACG